jgi:hypothetical protein
MAQTYDGVEIFPPIGISRVGDSTEPCPAFENPDREHPDEFTFRGPDGKIRPSAVTFHAYLHREQEAVWQEATKENWTLTWTVNVANKKAAWVRFKGKDHQETFRLRNPRVDAYVAGQRGVYEHTDYRPKLTIQHTETVSSEDHTPKTLTGSFTGSTGVACSVDLGKIWTDTNGRLVFLAGTGESKSVRNNTAHPDLLDKFDNDDWYDTVCDGNVTVTAQPKSGSNTITRNTPKLKTIVITAPPKFTNGLYCPSSLYDVIEDVYEWPRRFGRRDYDCGDVFYDSDIKPIIECARFLSWTNLKANEGHGPHREHRFPHDRLSVVPTLGTSGDHGSLRQSIFDRVRAPIRPHDPANRFIRNDQAHDYYMPRLAGDSGDMPEDMDDSNHRDRWSSLTELQYDRLAKWAKGEFKTGSRFTDEPIQSKLTRAALKWTTGAPLYPGIEVYWVAALSSTYNHGTRFRFHETVKPGDLTKGLSLPWQADFFMCNMHWWPHIRPDEVVTQETWKKAPRNGTVHPDSLTKRNLWDEGLQKLLGDETVGSTEMVKKWNKLGFITQVQQDPLILVENERALVREGAYTISNVSHDKYVGCTSIDGSRRPVIVVPSRPVWHIKYVEPLRMNLYRIIIADFTAAADDGTTVNAHGGTSGRNWNEWFIEATASRGEYTIATNDQARKYWTLAEGADGTQVTVEDRADDFANQKWKLNYD